MVGTKNIPAPSAMEGNFMEDFSTEIAAVHYIGVLVYSRNKFPLSGGFQNSRNW
jgi:hypothetical protein